MPTVSIVKGKGYLSHNDRTLESRDAKLRSWDPELTDRNVVYVNRDIREVYHELFDDALNDYNARQTRDDRIIMDYYDKISRSKQEKPYYELIVQIGDSDTIKKGTVEYDNIKMALDDYAKTFQENNPNFKLVQMIMHNDEKGLAHLHIDFVPFSTGNKRGLSTKNSMRGALKEMGYDRQVDFKQWRSEQLDKIIGIMKDHGLEYVVGSGTHEHLNVRMYKAVKRMEEDLSDAQKRILEAQKEELSTIYRIKVNRSQIARMELEKAELEKKTGNIEPKKPEKEDLQMSELEKGQKELLELSDPDWFYQSDRIKNVPGGKYIPKALFEQKKESDYKQHTLISRLNGLIQSFKPFVNGLRDKIHELTSKLGLAISENEQSQSQFRSLELGFERIGSRQFALTDIFKDHSSKRKNLERYIEALQAQLKDEDHMESQIDSLTARNSDLESINRQLEMKCASLETGSRSQGKMIKELEDELETTKYHLEQSYEEQVQIVKQVLKKFSVSELKNKNFDNHQVDRIKNRVVSEKMKNEKTQAITHKKSRGIER